jgi:hypothetical protein
MVYISLVIIIVVPITIRQHGVTILVKETALRLQVS